MNVPLTRRTLLGRTAVITGAAIAASLPGSQFLASPAYAAGTDSSPTFRKAVKRAQERDRRVPTGKRSVNGWEMEHVADGGGTVYSRPVPGTPLDGVAVRMGDVETVLVYVVRRFHYEIDELREGDVVGWRSPAKVRVGLAESNQASGTAVQIRPDHYPSGSRGGFFPQQLLTIRDILAELDGVVRWGGNCRKPDEALFSIDVKPGDLRLARVAAKLNRWAYTPGQGAGVLRSPAVSDRASIMKGIHHA